MFPTPQHPLPEGIVRLDKEDTVCQYCGVSYLILHEIKQLKKELLDAKSEISELKSYKISYEELLEKWKEIQANTDFHTALVKEKDTQISTLEKRNDILLTENARVSELSEKLTKSTKATEILRSSYESVFQQLRSLKLQLTSLKSTVSNQTEVYSEAMNTSLLKVHSEVMKVLKESANRDQLNFENQIQELTLKFREKEAAWQDMEIKLREADASSSRELVNLKSQMMDQSHSTAETMEEFSKLKRENGDYQRQVEANKASIRSLEKSLSDEQKRFSEMRAIVDQRATDNETLSHHMKQLNMELERLRSDLLNKELETKNEKEELTRKFGVQLKTLEMQLQKDLEMVEADHRNQYQLKEEKLKQSILHESDTRLRAIQENFENERNRFESKVVSLASELESSQSAYEEIKRTKDFAEKKAADAETKLRKLERILKELHEEKLAESNRAKQADQEVLALHSIIERQCAERNEMTESLNVIKREIIKAKLPPDVLDDLMSKVSTYPSNNSNLENIENSQSTSTDAQSPRTRAWSFDKKGNHEDNLHPSVLKPAVKFEGKAKKSHSEIRLSSENISSQMSHSAFANLVDNRRQVMATRKSQGALALPPIGSSNQASLNSAGEETILSSVTPSPLGVYQRHESTSTIRSNEGRDAAAANTAARQSLFQHAGLRQSMSETQIISRPPRLPLGKLRGAADIRSKIAAVLSRK